jgi:hypothetical protein
MRLSNAPVIPLVLVVHQSLSFGSAASPPHYSHFAHGSSAPLKPADAYAADESLQSALLHRRTGGHHNRRILSVRIETDNPELRWQLARRYAEVSSCKSGSFVAK